MYNTPSQDDSNRGMGASAVDLPAQIRSTSSLRSRDDYLRDARQHVDDLFPDLDELLGDGVSGSTSTGAATGSSLQRTESRGGQSYQAGRRGKRRRTLNEEVTYWEKEEAAATAEAEKTANSLPTLLDETQTRLQTLLSSAQKLSLERHTLADHLSGLIDGLDKRVDAPVDAKGAGDLKKIGPTLVEQMADLQDELARLEAGLTWAMVLEQVITLSEKVLSPTAHNPSPLAALPTYGELHDLVEDLLPSLPDGMSLKQVIIQLREATWAGLKDALAKNLLAALETIKWPTKIAYPSLPAEQRRTFERAFTDMLVFQAEGEVLRGSGDPVDWTTGSQLLPISILAKPVELRFKYHFMGAKTTNRLDKPEWAFASLLDQLYQHTPFINNTIANLARSNGFGNIDVRAEYTLALLSTALGMLRLRIPQILDRPSLLAHTIYQTIVFDDSIRQGGFSLANTVAGRTGESAKDGTSTEWQGLTSVILREAGWYEHWLHEIIASTDAWTITDEAIDEDDGAMDGQRPTVSARQVKALIEQVTDRYLALPELRHRLPFLQSIQIPALEAYHTRISGSLDAFENLSSAFARAIPGALSGNTRGGAHFDQSRLTGGEAGLGRLIKAELSASWMLSALKAWADEPFFIELSADAKSDAGSKWVLQNDAHLAFILDSSEGASVFDRFIEQFTALCTRAQDMMVRLVTVEVEAHLKDHLKRRWDTAPGAPVIPSSHLLSALSTYTNLLWLISTDLPPLVLSKVYRRIVSHLSNHVAQRAVYSGWSKFTSEGGREFADEIRDFVSSSLEILNHCKRPANIGIEAPWRTLSDAARILQLPMEERDGPAFAGEVTFKQAMAAAWAHGEESLKVFQDRAGVRMDRGQLQGVLRRRTECWL